MNTSILDPQNVFFWCCYRLGTTAEPLNLIGHLLTGPVASAGGRLPGSTKGKKTPNWIVDATPMAYTGHPFGIVQLVLGSFIGLSKNFGSSFSFSSQRSLQPTLQKPSAKTSNTAPSAPCQLQQVVSFIFQFLGMAHLLCHRAVFAQLQNLLVLTASLGRPELSNAQVSVTSIYSVYPSLSSH